MDGNSLKISVIVPVYNVEKYIEECIESLLAQTYSNLEIILIDDGSTDCSGSICDEYAARDSRIKVIHQKNGGAASAKNAGLRVASGEYLAFVDSDDYLEPDAYMYMLSKLMEYKADIIHCNHRDIYKDTRIDRLIINKEEVYDTEEYLVGFTKEWICSLLWDKLYRRKLFDNIFFEEGHKIDDEFFTYQGVMNAKRIVSTPKIVYNYRKRKSSVMMSVESQQKIVVDRLEYLYSRRKKVVEKFPALRQIFDYHYLNMLAIVSTDSAVTLESLEKIQQLLNEYFKEKRVCKMEFSLWKKILILRYSKSEKLLERCRTEIEQDAEFNCFE